MVHTNKKSNTFCRNDFKKRPRYILCMDFNLHPISCQKSSLAYVNLLHLRLQKHFSLMTGKCSPILATFVSVMNSVPQWVIQLYLENESYKRLSWFEVLRKTYIYFASKPTMNVTRKNRCVKFITLKIVVQKFYPIQL